jgi:hypothetical protein
MKRYAHNYIYHTVPCKPTSVDARFGTMAHEVLYKAGRLRDDGDTDYDTIIPSEVLYHDLKLEFGISNWHQYFVPIIKQLYEYEKQLIAEMSGDVEIEREIKLQLTPSELKKHLKVKATQPLVGIIDLLLITDTHATIIDYKFSKTRKTQDDFDMNSQLQLYALLVHINYGIPLRNIKIGYIDIPKQASDTPTLLSNGTLSRSKSQNITQEFYAQAVKALHGEDQYYNCNAGGHYYDIWCYMALNKVAYMNVQYLDIDTFHGIINEIANIITVLETFLENKLPFIGKTDSYSCKSCEFINSCKTWLGV